MLRFSANNTGHRERLKMKYAERGQQAFMDYEKLELLLTYAIPRRDVKPLAKALLNHFKNLANVMNASRQELLQVKGIGFNAALLIELFRDLYSDILTEKVCKSNAVANTQTMVRFVQSKIEDPSRENMVIVYLTPAHEIIDAEVISHGSIDKLYIHPRDLMANALKCGAAGIILVHNHPSGSVEPSIEDRRMTDLFNQFAQFLSIRILDHLILTKTHLYSIAENMSVPLDDETFQLKAEGIISQQKGTIPFNMERLRVMNFAELASIKKGTGENKC